MATTQAQLLQILAAAHMVLRPASRRTPTREQRPWRGERHHLRSRRGEAGEGGAAPNTQQYGIGRGAQGSQ
jgi:hypothetical protein